MGRKKTKVNVQDWESKWTALHRSVFFGQLGASVLLIKVLLYSVVAVLLVSLRMLVLVL